MDIEAFSMMVVASWIIMKVTEAIITPLFDRFSLDKFWIVYVTIVIGALLGWTTEINAFPVFRSDLVGRALSSLVISLGPSFIYDLMDGWYTLRAKPEIYVISAEEEENIIKEVTG